VPLTLDDVRRVARLARLELTDDESAVQLRSINELMERFESLRELDVEGIEPTAHSAPINNVLREDAARPSLPRDEALAGAPDAREGCFAVPLILEAS
jgi:aspartyl-tRNA(Asn)/glutamyl-tRNA(Gln) amidotransferase subunit C